MTGYTTGFLLLAAIGVVSFDTIASVTSLMFKIPYRAFRFGSLAMFFVVGYIAARSFGPLLGPVAGAYVGLVESTVGWAIAWRIGPGRLPPEHARWPVILSIVVFVTVLAASFGGLGAMLGSLFEQPVQR